LLQHGALINYYNPRSEVGTALYVACMQGHANSAAKLLGAGAALLAQVTCTSVIRNTAIASHLSIVLVADTARFSAASVLTV